MGDKYRLGIMGGSFDPIHLGHLKAAEIAGSKLDLDEIVFVTAFCPPHKSVDDLAPAEHRFAMVDIAIKDHPLFSASKIEMEKSCPVYAGDTIEMFKNKRIDSDIYFITGLDAVLTILNYDKARTYPGLSKFIAVTRPGYNRTEIEKKIPEEFKRYYTILEDPTLSVSSTEIRNRIREGKTISYMVPEKVKDYILKHNLYGGKRA